MRPPNQYNNANFDEVNDTTNFVETYGIRYPKDTIDFIYQENNCLYQYGASKQLYKEFDGESLLNIFISYFDMLNYFPIQINDLRFPVNHVTPKNIQLFEKYQEATVNTL